MFLSILFNTKRHRLSACLYVALKLVITKYLSVYVRIRNTVLETSCRDVHAGKLLRPTVADFIPEDWHQTSHYSNHRTGQGTDAGERGGLCPEVRSN